MLVATSLSRAEKNKFGEVIEVTEEMKPPEGKFSSSYLVELESQIGMAHDLRLETDQERYIAEKLIADILENN